MQAWMFLFTAGVLEVCWTIGVKSTDGCTRPGPMLFTALAMFANIYLLSRATQTLPLGTAYAVLVGMGAAGSGILGMLLFNEPATLLRLGFLALLVFSVAGLKYTA